MTSAAVRPLVALVAVAVSLAAAAGTISRAASPARLVVFVQLQGNGPGSDDIAALYVATVGSRSARRLTAPCVDCADTPRFSPDGRQIAFLNRGPIPSGISVIGPDGTGESLICNTDCAGAGNPVFSPDGSRLALSLARGGVGIEPLTGWPLKRLAGTGSWPVTNLDWSPVGGQLAVGVRDVDVNMVGVDGASPRRIATGAAGPRFSPNGSRISYARSDMKQVTVRNRLPPLRAVSFQLPLRFDAPSWWDDRSLFYVSGHGFFRYDLASHSSTQLGPLPNVCHGHGRFCAEFDLQPAGH